MDNITNPTPQSVDTTETAYYATVGNLYIYSVFPFANSMCAKALDGDKPLLEAKHAVWILENIPEAKVYQVTKAMKVTEIAISNKEIKEELGGN